MSLPNISFLIDNYIIENINKLYTKIIHILQQYDGV